MNRSSNETAWLEEIRQLLDRLQASYSLIEHQTTIRTAEEGVQQGVGSLSSMTPTLILKTEKGYLAAVLPGDRRLSYKKIKKQLGLKNISLAEPATVKQLTGAEVGTVSLINPGIETIIDASVVEKEMIFGGCGMPGLTLKIRAADLIRATNAVVFDFTESKDVARGAA